MHITCLFINNLLYSTKMVSAQYLINSIFAFRSFLFKLVLYNQLLYYLDLIRNIQYLVLFSCNHVAAALYLAHPCSFFYTIAKRKQVFEDCSCSYTCSCCCLDGHDSKIFRTPVGQGSWHKTRVGQSSGHEWVYTGWGCTLVHPLLNTHWYPQGVH
jgi:hypothetical protein